MKNYANITKKRKESQAAADEMGITLPLWMFEDAVHVFDNKDFDPKVREIIIRAALVMLKLGADLGPDYQFTPMEFLPGSKSMWDRAHIDPPANLACTDLLDALNYLGIRQRRCNLNFILLAEVAALWLPDAETPKDLKQYQEQYGNLWDFIWELDQVRYSTTNT